MYIGTPLPGVALAEGKFVSASPTDEDWWFRFNKGMKLRMGEKRVQDEAITAGMVVGLAEIMDAQYWRTGVTEGEREEMEELMCYVLTGFGAGLRGEEVPLLSLEGLLYFWVETKEEADPYIMLTLRGRFKGETGLRWHCLPLSDQTKSGIPHRRWLGRLMHRRVIRQGRRTGLLLHREEGGKVRLSDFEPAFQEAMGRLQEERPELFSVGTVLDNFSLKRSLRRGAILAVGDEVSDNVVNMMNRWRKKERARGTEPGLSMRQHYTQVRGMVQALKTYSAAM